MMMMKERKNRKRRKKKQKKQRKRTKRGTCSSCSRNHTDCCLKLSFCRFNAFVLVASAAVNVQILQINVSVLQVI